MDQRSGEADEAYQARMLAWSTEMKKRADDAAAAAKKKAEDAEQARLLALEQQRQHDEAAARAADKERNEHREKIFSGEQTLLTTAAAWWTEAENGKLEDCENKIALLLSHLTDLLATCITQQEDIHSLDDSLTQVQGRVQQLEQRPVAAADASSSNTSDRLDALEMDVGSLKDGVQSQQTATQQLEQRICTAANTSSPEPRETTPKFDEQEIFCDSTKTDPIPCFRKSELTLQLHNVKEHKHHAYLYSRSGGACQAWLDNLLSKYGVVAADLHTKISWGDLKAAWHKRFQVEPPQIKAMDKLMVFEQGTLPTQCAHLHTYLSFYAPPTSPTDDEVAVGDILAYTTKVAREFRTPRYDDNNAPLMYVRIQVGQASCNALLDSGTSRNFMSQSFMQRAGLGAQVRRKANPTAIKLADGKTQQLLDRYIEAVPVYFAPHACEPVTFDILDMDFDIILGMPWLASADHTVNFHRRTLSTIFSSIAGHWKIILGIFDECWRRSAAPSTKANRDKCEFVRQELECLGHFVTPEGISPPPDKIQAIQEWAEPRNVTDVRSFLGLAGYYQCFMKGYSKIAAHLTKLQCEDRPFDFGEEARESFLALKAALLSAEVLRIYDPLLPTRVTTDASGYGIGAALEQHDGVDWHPVEYFSKKVSVVHSIDDARKKELLAFVHTLKRLRHFLLGRSQFRWVTDNNPLVFYKTQDTVNSTIARWMTFIDQFDFFPDHIPGKSNRFADALSRRPDLCIAVYSTFEIDDDLRNSFIRGYQADPEFRDKYANCSSPNLAPSHYRIQEGYLLVHTWGKDLLCVPSDPHLRTRLLGEFHDAPATGHFGVNRTIGRLRQ
ncbi:hypothetical protein CBR_g21801 [Chara braunii]|uniref:Reverse transcriptase/retrotransposon-derived protein RNase H-like domain-containing protein n=1 Tax=Chara braunii TaxID=69332 RepID=A0A388JUH1_CHABU|nr:hypothetical protein CBR_g21801 [Chara braunii]|eukprot:GBG61456.1 hypothetical protein CBR_g21801 [Chara braunii]